MLLSNLSFSFHMKETLPYVIDDLEKLWSNTYFKKPFVYSVKFNFIV